MNKQPHPLSNVLLRVLEDWGMMLVDPAECSNDAFQLDNNIYIVRVAVHGGFEGMISIVAQRPFLNALAANLLGEVDAEEISEDECRDALKEMGNVLAGNFLTEVYGDDVAFDILHPEVGDLNVVDLSKIVKAPQTFMFLGDDQPVLATFEIRG